MAVSKQLAVQRLRLTRQQQQFDTPVYAALRLLRAQGHAIGLGRNLQHTLGWQAGCDQHPLACKARSPDRFQLS